ncbi:MAG: thioesterase family protein [Deltaproteobacteria bacterium]|nr:thioesterase family protein [Deltaproteobacteria bacterium]
MKRIERPVRFEEVDAAGLLFFPIFAAYAHEAMAALFDGLPGGYPAMILERRIGLPAVAMTSSFRSPLRFGDVAIIETTVTRLGNRSCELSYEFLRKADGASCASMTHTVVTTDLTEVKSCPMPADVRREIERHLVAASE